MMGTGYRVRVLDADLTLESIGIPEEEAEHGTEIGDEVVGRLPGHQAFPNSFEGFERRGLEGQVVEAPSPEHRCLAIGLGVAVDLEHVELGPVAHLDDGESRSLSLWQLGAVA
jgi:hypothetical protein